MSDLTQAKVLELFVYNPEIGVFTNRVDRRHSRAGCEAGNTGSKGYRRIKIDNREYATHRLAWLYVYGVWPTKSLDHVDRNPLNNRIANLREATFEENRQNLGKVASNTSGYIGVTYNKACRKWQASIGCAGKKFYLGLFALPEHAHAAYVAAKAKLHLFQPTFTGDLG